MISVNQTKEAQSQTKFQAEVLEGLATCKVLAINPTKEQLHQIGINTEKEPVYASTKQVSGRLFPDFPKDTEPLLRIVVWLELISPETLKGKKIAHTFWMNGNTKTTKDGRIQIIDEFGRFAFISKEDLTQRKIPKNKNGNNSVSDKYRPAWIGETEVTDFLRTWVKVPFYQEGKSNPDDCAIRLEIDNGFWKGNVTEITSLLPICKDRKIKVLLTGETGSDGILRQAVAGFYGENAQKDTIINRARSYWPTKFSPIRLETFDDAHPLRQAEATTPPAQVPPTNSFVPVGNTTTDELPF